MKIADSFYTGPIERKEGLTTNDFIENYCNRGIPVVIPGAMKEWKAFEKWDASFFRDSLGDKMVPIMGEKMKLRDFMDTVIASDENHPSKYLNEVNIHTVFPELLTDITPFLQYALPDRLMSNLMPGSWGMRNGVIELLIGGKGTKFPTIHYDGFHMNTFITQIRGDKEFFLYPPDQTPYMYPAEPGSNKSLVNDVHQPDLNKFPLFAKAKQQRVTVYEGDTIFLPAGWWHTTRLLTLSIAVSTNNVGPHQWSSFVKDFSKHLSQSPLKQKVYEAYLHGAGSMMALRGK
jgi:histone arginine demethylase JMJD6